MAFKRLVLASLSCVCLVITAPAFAEAQKVTKDIPATALFPFLQQYYNIPAAGRDHFHLVYALGGNSLQTFHAVLKRKSGEVPIMIGPDGIMSPVPTAEDIAAKTVISMTSIKGVKMGVSVHLVETIEATRTMDARQLKIGLDQARAGVKSVAGLMAMAVPDYQRLCFNGSVSGQVILSDGKAIAMLPASKSGNTPCYRPNDFPTATQVSLSQTPKAVTIEPK